LGATGACSRNAQFPHSRALPEPARLGTSGLSRLTGREADRPAVRESYLLRELSARTTTRSERDRTVESQGGGMRRPAARRRLRRCRLRLVQLRHWIRAL